jgi:hypothetical protein
MLADLLPPMVEFELSFVHYISGINMVLPLILAVDRIHSTKRNRVMLFASFSFCPFRTSDQSDNYAFSGQCR